MRSRLFVLLICIPLIIMQGCSYKSEREKTITEVSILNGYHRDSPFYDVCITMNQDGGTFNFISTLSGLEDCSISFPAEDYENMEDINSGDYASMWGDFCRNIQEYISDKGPLTEAANTDKNLYEVFYSDGTSYLYDDSCRDGELSVYEEAYSVLFDWDTTMSEDIENTINKAYEKEIERQCAQLGIAELEPLQQFRYCKKSSDNLGLHVYSITSDHVNYFYFLFSGLSETEYTYGHAYDKEFFMTYSPDANCTVDITSAQWDELSNNPYLMLASALARNESEDTVDFRLDDLKQSEPYIVFSDGSSINDESDTFSFTLSEAAIRSWLRKVDDKGKIDQEYGRWRYYYTFDNYDVSAMSPLENIYSIYLMYESNWFSGSAEYYVDADLKFRVTTYNSDNVPITTESTITEQQWDDLIHSKGMLIAQQGENVPRNPYIDGGICELSSRSGRLLSSNDIGDKRLETEYVIIELEKLGQECGLIQEHRRVLEEARTTIDPGLMKDENVVNGWVYFLYPLEESGFENAYTLYRRREDGTELTQLSNRSDEYTVLNDCVYYTSYTYMHDHGELRVIKPDAEPLYLAYELYSYQIIEPYIYYIHSYDTIGVGIEGHALQRINLDGSNHMIVAYETAGPGIGGGHWGFRVEGEYAYLNNIRIRMSEPADGTEVVEVIGPVGQEYDDEWIYYTTNCLIKARADGSEQIILDGDETTWLEISSMDDEWIYYGDVGQGNYKIRRDGSGKQKI